MREFLLPILALMATLSAAQAQYFTQGNLAVVQMGTATQAAATTGEPVSIVQFTTAGVPVGTPLTLPSTGASAFILDNSATEGFMTLSGNGKYLVLGGYNTNIQTSSLTGFTSTNVFRAVATIDGYGNFALPITNSHIYSTYNIRGAVSDGLGNFWVSGSGGTGASIANGEIGIIYVGGSSLETNVTVTETGTGNERCLNIYNNDLYLSTGSGSGLFGRGIYLVSNSVTGGIPTNTGSTANNTNIMQTGSTSGPYDFAINAAGTIAYVAEDNLGGIIKFTSTGLPGALWVSNYTISALTPGAPAADTNAEAVTADFTQNPPVIYATTGEGAGDRLIQIVDNGPASTATLLATAPAGTIYRGVRFVPAAYPVIATPPLPVEVDAGQTASFSVGVTGTPPFAYQWYSNNVAILLATSSNLDLANPNTGQTGTQIYVVVSNSVGGAQSIPVTLTVDPPGPPANIVVTPSSQTVNAGTTVTFNASAVGAPALTYGWTQDGVPLTDGGNISGSSTAALTIANALAANDGSYLVLVTNSLGHGASALPGATLQVVDPAIETGPLGATNLPGASGPTLTVAATGSGTLTYQWYSNNVAISGANSSSYAVPGSSSITQASYTVTVSNGSGNSITSSPTVVAYTPVLLWDAFDYPNGNLATNHPWKEVYGSRPELVMNDRVQIAQTNEETFLERAFSAPQSGQVLWASFTINLTTLPSNPGGVYFADFTDTGSTFLSRIFALTTNAFPGTYRLGIADENANYSSSTHKGGPSAVMPLNLAPGIDYQVVYMYDSVNAFGQLWVNPASVSDVNSGPTGDVGSTALPMANFELGQQTGEGIMTLGNLLVSLDYNGVGSGFGVVATNVPALPVIGLQPVGTTNYSGNDWTMEVAASGIGLTYSWALNNNPLSDDGVTISGSATPKLSLTGLGSGNAGTYTVTVQNSAGPTASWPTIVSVNSTPTAPMVSVMPQSVSVAVGSSASFSATAAGTGPLSYQWSYYNGSTYTPLSDGTTAGTTISGSQTSILTISGLGTNATGGYAVTVTGGAGSTPSQPAQLTVVPPASVNISFLRSLMSPTTFAVSDGTTLYNITGTITTRTNLTSGNTASYYLQDSTGGINLFVASGSAFRPNLGDVVTATGLAASYGDNLEIDVDGSNPQQVYGVLTNGDGSPMTNALPAPIVFPWGYQTVNEPFTVTNIEGSVIMLTNAYFTNTGTFAAGVTYNVFSQPNGAGILVPLYLSAQVTDTNSPGQSLVGQPIPSFAYSITGPLAQYSTTVYEIELTSYAQIVSAPPPAGTAAAARSGAGETNLKLAWTAVPYNYSYSILYSTNVAGPYQSLASGLTFTNTLGTFTDIHRTNSAGFYQITTP